MKYLKEFLNELSELDRYIILSFNPEHLYLYELEKLSEEYKLYLCYSYNEVTGDIKKFDNVYMHKLTYNDLSYGNDYIKFHSNLLEECLEYFSILKKLNKYNI